MRRPTRALWAAALATGLVAAQDPPQQDPPKQQPPTKRLTTATAPAKADDPASAAFDALRKEKQKLSSAVREKYEAAKDPTGQKKIRDEFFASVRKMDLDFARKYPKHPSSFELLASIGTKEAQDLLLQNYADDKRLGMATLQMSMSDEPGADRFIRAVREKAKDEATKAQATVALALSLKNQGDAAEDAGRAAALLGEAEKVFEEAGKTYANVETPLGKVGELAKKNLFELHHLSVGKPAPEVDGKDVDDKPMKLSDYRGKVVLLDFWAHW